jgi:hypothetical protein
VEDAENDRSQVFASNGTLIETWGALSSGEGEFDFTTIGWGGYNEAAIAFDPDCAFYVTDTCNHRIQKFGPDRSFLTAWDREGQAAGHSSPPSTWSWVGKAGSTSSTPSALTARSW